MDGPFGRLCAVDNSTVLIIIICCGMDFHVTSISQHFVGGLNPLAHPLNTALDVDISFPANDMGRCGPLPSKRSDDEFA